MNAVATARLSLGRQSWNFTRHFLEMCITMCAGGAILGLIVFGIPASIGAPDVREQFPEIGLILIAILLTLPMAAWMRFRGMEWRPIVEMSAIPIGLAVVLIGAASSGLASDTNAANDVRDLLRHLLHGNVRRHALPPRPVHGAKGPPHGARGARGTRRLKPRILGSNSTEGAGRIGGAHVAKSMSKSVRCDCARRQRITRRSSLPRPRSVLQRFGRTSDTGPLKHASPRPR